jgi:hypothetical protein
MDKNKNPYAALVAELTEFAAKATTTDARTSLLLLAQAYRNLGVRAQDKSPDPVVQTLADPAQTH